MNPIENAFSNWLENVRWALWGLGPNDFMLALGGYAVIVAAFVLIATRAEWLIRKRCPRRWFLTSVELLLGVLIGGLYLYQSVVADADLLGTTQAAAIRWAVTFILLALAFSNGTLKPPRER